MKRAAQFSDCGNYRFTLTRIWDERPVLLVVMFNPSKADAEKGDPTVDLVCHIASHNGYGGIVVVNGIPLCGSKPHEAIRLTNEWDQLRDWHFRDRLFQNTAFIEDQVRKAGAVLLAWGALAGRCGAWFDHVREQIESALPEATPLYCLGKTKDGFPIHPLARGKLRLKKTAPLLLWSNAEANRRLCREEKHDG